MATANLWEFSDDTGGLLVDNECVGLAFRQDKLYLLSLDENANNVCDENMNDSPSANVTKKRKRIDDASLKL